MINQNTNIILAGNSSYLNRGCEAITRGTVEILKHYYKEPKIIAASFFDNYRDYKMQLANETDDSIKHIMLKKHLTQGNIKNIYRILESYYYTGNLRYYSYEYLNKFLKNTKVVLAVGGDVYSLDYGIPKPYTDLNEYFLSKRKPVILWGASVGPFTSKPKYEAYMKKHLKRITAIFAREDVTMDYLDSIGVNKKVYRVTDPAFLLPIQQPKDITSIPDNSIGINISPLMSRYITKNNIDQLSYKTANIIDKIISKTDKYIYLIPHVGATNSNVYKKDYRFLKKVNDLIKDKERVVLIEDKYSASEMKWIISKMQVFMGARTHATIASLSSGVPTISFVYSIKGLGINKDIFNHTDYCIKKSEWNPDIILEKLIHVLDNEKMIRAYLDEKIPVIKQQALLSGKYLRKLFKE
ncbi:MAG TPA: polysaccharide pyruvyl transferase family protein [Defluviitaleaceae bacterium]|nr:polysaccharide pyruvyl transferase family protein [Candidatus Epulonipiscium sp.]HOA81387.1 polysaccharide pyruvyl transferase family protein [Defluviitaleaceae bacterium]